MKLTKEYVQGLLDKTENALSSLEVTEAGKPVYEMAQRYLADAKHFFKQGDFEMAMAAEEYAHGLLDGGVGSGVLKVLKNEELFVF